MTGTPSTALSVTDRTRLRRLPKRGVFDRDAIYRILDEGFVCHVGFVVDGQPYAIPTGYARVGDSVYLHGSAASRMLRSLRDGVEACVTVTLLDGLVIARSAFHHSMNYRSAVIFGTAREVTDREEKLRALDALVEHVLAGRSTEARPANEKELRQTMVLALPIEEASAKVRTGGPIDDDEDYDLPVWAGVVPVGLAYGEPVDDGRVVVGVSQSVINATTAERPRSSARTQSTVRDARAGG